MQTINAKTSETALGMELVNGMRFTSTINLTGGPVPGIVAGNFGMLPDEYQEAAGAATYAVYHYETPILWQSGDGKWYVPMFAYSARTSSYRNKMMRALDLNGAEIVKI